MRVLDQAQQQSRIQYQRHEDSGKTQLLGQRCQNKIGIPDRHETQLVLASVAESLAPESSGAHGNFRLEDLVARTLGVVLRTMKGGDPLLLVGLQSSARRPAASCAAASTMTAMCFHCMPARYAPTATTGTSTIAVPRSGCSKIRPSGTAVSTHRLEQIPQGKPVCAHIGKKTRQHDDYNQLGKFRHLEKLAEHGQPALGAESRVADGQNRDQRQDPIR